MACLSGIVYLIVYLTIRLIYISLTQSERGRSQTAYSNRKKKWMKNKGTDNSPKKEYLEVSRSLALQFPFSCFPLACKASGLHIQTSYALQLLHEICIFLQPPPGSHIQNTTHPALLSSWPTQILLCPAPSQFPAHSSIQELSKHHHRSQ